MLGGRDQIAPIGGDRYEDENAEDKR